MNRIRTEGRWWARLHDTQGAAGQGRRERLRLRPAILFLEGRQLLATLNVTNTKITGPGSLSAAIQTADSNKQSNTIEFTGSVFNSPQTIDVFSALKLTDTTGKQTIVGPSQRVTLEAIDSTDVLSVSANVKASISGLTLKGGTRDGLYNDGISTIVSDCTITKNTYGVVNDGTLTINDYSIVSNNSGTSKGGGIVNLGTLSADNVTISGNADPNGTGAAGGVTNGASGTATLTDCTITGNKAPMFSGGVAQASNEALTVTGGTISDNSGSIGGGVGIWGGGAVTITGTYFEHNSATQNGGGLAVNHEGGRGKVTELSDCTFYDNTARVSGGGIFNALVLGATAPALLAENCTIAGNSAETGGGVFNASAGTFVDCTITGNTATTAGGLYSQTGAAINGTIVANNSATGTGNTPNIGTMNSLSVVSGSHNLIGPGSSGGLSSTTNLLDVTNPLLGTLGKYGSSAFTIPLLPGSPAIGAGISIADITMDERGVTRPATDPDIGAYQDRGFTFTITSGGTPSEVVGQPFGEPLTVLVTSPAGDPVAGGVVTFTVHATTASATLSSLTATIGSKGDASVTGTANHVTGSYVIAASAVGASSSADFIVTNVPASGSAAVVLNAVDDAIEQWGAIAPSLFGDGTTPKH